DFNYFEIFRSETQGFEPTPEDLLATTTDIMYVDGNVVEETTYFYVITAKDFSGNTSGKSNQVSATITDVAIGGGIPTEYALSQNYPNPFNPSTAIKFAIPEAGNVKLLIYDSVGNEVAVLVNNTMSAGYYTFTWNATNYASGIYFYKLQSNNFSKVSKMLLIK
ncbi:MAG: T9SS type A sorting domain-containing protein, partial [Melioribacteraceae bacterium]|nr:T9SS type A sorting domain-containing protein [Melioribacteraceae bacterium]